MTGQAPACSICTRPGPLQSKGRGREITEIFNLPQLSTMETLCFPPMTLSGGKVQNTREAAVPADAGRCCCQSQQQTGSHIPVRCSGKQLLPMSQ